MLLHRFTSALDSLVLPDGSFGLVAVSGGGDSVALLDLLVQAARPFRLAVAHVDHGINPESGEIARRVESLAAAYRLECHVTRLELGAGASETTAREARYAALEEIRRRVGAEWLATGHHADDQAETVLLRVLHGSGPAGLAAMAPRQGAVVRPLLPFRREELAQYLLERNLPAWDDPANRDPRHLRSWLRESVLPHIRQRLPGVDAELIRVAAHAAQDRLAWDQVLDRLSDLEWRLETDGCSVAAARIGAYDSAVAGALLRTMARRVGLTLGADRSARVLDFIRSGQSGSAIELGGGWFLELEFGRARLLRKPARETPATAAGSLVEVSGERGEVELGRWNLHWKLEPAPRMQTRNGLAAWFIPGALRVRSWQAGDTIRPLKGRGSRLVVKCFQEAEVARQERAEWPVLLDAAGQVVWVPGVCRSESLVPEPGVEALRVDAEVT
jgi:tRNA(Ile)-lysidine synthase